MDSQETKTAVLQKLTQTRAATLDVVAGLDEAQWQTAVYNDEDDANWTVFNLFCHVVDAERGMTGLMMQLQRGLGGVPDDFDLARWNARAVRKGQEKTPQALVDDMRRNRHTLLQFIDGLQGEDWEKSGRHGSGQVLTIEEICRLIADHEQAHVAQMQQAIGQ